MLFFLLLSCTARLGPPGEGPGPVFLDLGPDKPRLCVSSVPGAGELPDRGTGWSQGLAALQAQDVEAARAALTGDHPGLHAARATVDLASGEVESGRVALRDLANAWPEDACLQQAAGFAYLTVGKMAAGTGFVAEARRLSPNEPDIVLLDGLVRTWKGDASGAAQAYRETLVLVPAHPLASAMLATAAIANGDAASAVPHLEHALAGGLDVSGQLAPAYFASGQLGDYLRVTSAAGWPLGDGGSLATAEDPEAAFRALLGVVGDTLEVGLVTSMGTLRCSLYWREAPVTVANFVGLARGSQPWVDPVTGQPGTGGFFDDSVMHRVIPDFMIQMGDPTGTGSGHPGYRFADEIVVGLGFDRPGLLGMANNGPDRNGSQFFVTEVATPHLDGRHTVFGQCDDESLEVVRAIARVPVGGQNKPIDDVVLLRVRVPFE